MSETDAQRPGEQARPGSAPAGPAPGSADKTRAIQSIGVALRGSLPCAVCGYELQGLSVRAVCPECGTAVRATILYKVDPQADVLQPLPRPRLTALGLVVWSVAGLLAVLLCWVPRVADMVERLVYDGARTIASPAWLTGAIVVLILLSGVGGIALLKPTRGCRKAACLAALAGLLAYIPLAWAVWRIQARVDMDGAGVPPYFVADPNPTRIGLRLLVAACLVVVIVGLRFNARRLVQRSLALRTGRVDRQTLLAMAGVVAIGAAGDGLRLFALRGGGALAEPLADVGSMIIVLSSLLLTFGAAAALADSWRIANAILAPSPGVRQVFGLRPPPPGQATGEMPLRRSRNGPDSAPMAPPGSA